MEVSHSRMYLHMFSKWASKSSVVRKTRRQQCAREDVMQSL